MASNCRNPNYREFGPWCYVSLNGSWEYCDIPMCEGTAMTCIWSTGHNESIYILVHIANNIVLDAFVVLKANFVIKKELSVFYKLNVIVIIHI